MSTILLILQMIIFMILTVMAQSFDIHNIPSKSEKASVQGCEEGSSYPCDETLYGPEFTSYMAQQGFKIDTSQMVDTASYGSDLSPHHSQNTTAKEVTFVEWRTSPAKDDDHSEQLTNVLKDYGYSASKSSYSGYNEFTPNMEMWEKRYNDDRLSKIITEKSRIKSEDDGMEKYKQFKYIPLGEVKDFNGATVNYARLKVKHTHNLQFQISPKEMDFGVVELCVPMYKNLTLKNIDSMKNIDIASITTESSQVIIDYDVSEPILIRPGRKITVKVTITAEVKEPVKTTVIFTLRNGYKLLYLVKFMSIENSYGLEPMIVDKRRQGSNMVNFAIKNSESEDLEFTLSDPSVAKETSPITLYHASKKKEECEEKMPGEQCFEKLTKSEFKITGKKQKSLFKMHFNDEGKEEIEFVVHFVLKDLNSGEKKHFAVPVYIYLNNNEVDLYPSLLDFGVLYSNSGISHRLTVRAIPDNLSGVRVGYPFVPSNSYFEYDFSGLVHNQGVALPDDTFLVGNVVLKTNGLREGEHKGYIIFCKDKVCSNDEGKSRLFYRFTVAKDPLNARSKMHSFEIIQKSIKKKRKSFQIQLLWLKNTFHYPIRIDDITTNDRELSLTFMVAKKVNEISQDLHCCVSSISPFSENCKGCKTIIHNTNSNLHKLILNPDEDNEDIKIRYEHHLNKSRTVEVKYVIVWTEGTYIPIPVFIYDKSLGCSFENYSESEELQSPFMLTTSHCDSLPEFRQMDFGPIAADYSHSRMLTIVNLNPLSIFIDRIRVTKPTCNDKVSNVNVRLVPVRTIDIMTNQLKRNFENEDKVFDKIYDTNEPAIVQNGARTVSDSSDFLISPSSVVLFSIQLDDLMTLEDKECDKFEASIHFSSFQTPNFEIPITYQVLEGSITLFPSDMVRFAPAIPGTTQSRKILAKSSLKKPVYIKSVTSSNPKTVSAQIIKNKLYYKKKEEIIEISTVAEDQINSFLKLKSNAIFHHFMMNGRNIPGGVGHSLYSPQLTYFDVLAWQVEQKEWDYRQSSRSTETTSIITIETNMIHNISIPVKTVITKPTLLNVAKYNFGKVEVDTGKRGEITIHNPSEQPIEVSFFIAPSNFLDIILDELLSDAKLIKWKQLCDKSTFFNPYGRKMCEGLIELHSLSETRRKNVVDYFIRNYFNFIMNGEIDDHILTTFMSDQQLYLQQTVKNITDATDAEKPDNKKEVAKADYLVDYYSIFTKFFSFQSQEPIKRQTFRNEGSKGEPYDEIVESIKVRLNQMIDEAPQNIKNEFRNMLTLKKQNFFIQSKSECGQGQENSEKETKNTAECYDECKNKSFIIPGKSDFQYRCFHFFPSTLVNHTESTLLIKNNLTYIYPLQLSGSSGKGLFKITDVTVPYMSTIDDKLSFRSQAASTESGADIYFNLNMKHDLFKVKALENLTKKQLSEHLKTSILGDDKLTVKNISLIRSHKRTFRISNIGNFPTEIDDVTLSNHKEKSNGFAIQKLEDGRFEITYEPSFRNSKVSETILVKTKHSITEFKVEAYIPMYLLKFIDTHFRLTEIEEHIGNWYYLIILSFMLLTLLLLGTEIVEYIIFMKQKNINFSLITELITAYEKAQELAKEEQKLENVSEPIKTSNVQRPAIPSTKKTPVKQRQNDEDDSKAQIEEIKRRLADKVDFSDISKESPIQNKKQAKQPVKTSEISKNKPRSEKETKELKPIKEVLKQTQSASLQEKSQSIKQVKSKKNKDKENPFEVEKSADLSKEPLPTGKITKSKTEPMADRKSEVRSEASSKASADAKVDTKQKESEKGRSSLNESLKSSESAKISKSAKKKQKAGGSKAKNIPSKTVELVVTKDSPQQFEEETKVSQKEEEEVPQSVEKQSSKSSEHKRGKQSNQPKQNKFKETVVPTEEVKISEPVEVESVYDLPFEEVKPAGPKKKSPAKSAKESRVRPSKKVAIELTTNTVEEVNNEEQHKDNQEVVAPPVEIIHKVEHELKESKPETPIEVVEREVEEIQPVKLYKRQESSQASVISEPNQKARNRLSHAESKDSWIEPEDATDSYHPKSENTTDDKAAENASEEKSNHSQSAKDDQQDNANRPNQHKRVESDVSGQNQSQFSKIPNRQSVSKYNAFYKNDYNDLKYYQKSSYYDSQRQQKPARQNKRVQEHPKTSSYQDYKKGFYGKTGKYGLGRQEGTKHMSESYDTLQDYHSARAGKPVKRRKLKEEKPQKNTYYYGAQDDYSYQRYGMETLEEQEPVNINAETYEGPTPETGVQEEEKYNTDFKEADTNNFKEEQLEAPYKRLMKEDNKNYGSFQEEYRYQGFESPFDDYDKDDHQYGVFEAFRDPNKDFSLFAPVQDSMFGEDDQMQFDFLDESNPNKKEKDEVLIQFDNLEELRDQSEHFSYDIANKDISTKIQK